MPSTFFGEIPKETLEELLGGENTKVVVKRLSLETRKSIRLIEFVEGNSCTISLK